MNTESIAQSRTARSVLLAASIWLSAACGLADGDPWGEAVFAVSASLDEAGRATDDGYQTNNDYLVRIESFEIGFQDVSVTATSAAGISFDPANPPAGYSLCHNGHCHSDAGGLVDYEDIEVELAGASATGATTLQAIGAAASLTESPTALPLDVCSNDCRLERGELGLASLRAGGASVRLHVTDRRSGEQARLPEAGVSVELSSEDLFEWSAPISESIDGRADPMLEIAVDFQVPVTVFDGVDWNDPNASQELFSNLQSGGVLDIAVQRSPY